MHLRKGGGGGHGEDDGNEGGTDSWQGGRGVRSKGAPKSNKVVRLVRGANLTKVIGSGDLKNTGIVRPAYKANSIRGDRQSGGFILVGGDDTPGVYNNAQGDESWEVGEEGRSEKK